jgi:CBS domain containing-hemolysin-like protein
LDNSFSYYYWQSLLFINVSSFTAWNKFLLFAGLILVLLILLKIGQQILTNIIDSEEENSSSSFPFLNVSSDGSKDLALHVADVFLSVLLSSVFTAACIYLYSIELRGHSLYFLFILAIVSGLVLFAAFDFIAGLFSAAVIRNSKKPQVFVWFFMSIIFLSYPFRKLLERGIRQEKIIKRNTLTFSDLSEVIEHSEAKPEEEQEKELMKGVLNFSDLEVKEVMRSRVDVVSFATITPFSQVISGIIESGYSRFPVTGENLDNVLGILHIKDVIPFLSQDDDFIWYEHIRSALFVPENLKINELLREFQLKKTHIAVIVDEYGGTSGIVTLEDIIEEIVGEIDDEFDEENDGIIFEKISENEYVFDGKTSLNDFCKIISYSFDHLEKVKGDSETLAGLILNIEGKFPEQGKAIFFESLEFIVEAMDNRRIQSVKVKLLNESSDDNA